MNTNLPAVITRQLPGAAVKGPDRIYKVKVTFSGTNTQGRDVEMDFTCTLVLKGPVVIHGQVIIDRLADGLRLAMDAPDNFGWRIEIERWSLAQKYAERLRSAVLCLTERDCSFEDAMIGPPRYDE